MTFLERARARYTTKAYDAGKKVTEAQITELKEILRLSPSSINSQPWKFHFISDLDTKAELARVSYFNENKIMDAGHLVVFTVVDDLSLFEAQIREHLPEGAVAYYERFIKPRPEAEAKAWLAHQVYLSLGFFLGACAVMQIDATPMEGIQPDRYDALLGLKGYRTLFAVAIGYRNETDANQPVLRPKSRLDLESVVHAV